MPAGSRPPDWDAASLQEGWRTWLRVRHASLGDLHEDLIQQAVTDLLEWSRRQQQPPQEETLRRVGFRILERRVYDAFREDVRRWSSEPADPDAVPTATAGPEKSVDYAKLLRALIEVLTHLSAADRALVLRDELSRGRKSVMTPAERKRLSRLRLEIKARMLKHHGMDVDDM